MCVCVCVCMFMSVCVCVQQTFTGAGLDTAVITGLQPDEEYRCRIRCGSLRNFWKWSDWSLYLTFTTSMDRKGVESRESMRGSVLCD